MNTIAGREATVDILAEKTVRQIGLSHLLDTWMTPRKQYEDVRFSVCSLFCFHIGVLCQRASIGLNSLPL